MSIGTPTYSSGHIVTVTANNYNIANVIRTALKAYVSGGTAAWVDYDVVDDTAGGYCYIMKSIGDPTLGSGTTKGDTAIYIKIACYSTDYISIACLQDWSTDSATGSRETALQYVAVNNSTAIDWFLSVNEYGFAAVWVQGGLWYCAQAGTVIRPYSTAINGIGRVSVATSGTGTKIIDLDRDISANIQVGQKVWLLNLTPAAAALKTDYTELVTVSGVTSGTITVTGVTNTPYEIGSLVGIDPAPAFAFASTVVSCVGGSTPAFTSARDGSGTAPNCTATFGLLVSYDEPTEDPSFDGLYVANPVVLNMTGTGYTGFRGFLGTRVFACSNGTFVDEDTMKIDFDAAQVYKIFPSLANPAGSWVTAIGPGAT